MLKVNIKNMKRWKMCKKIRNVIMSMQNVQENNVKVNCVWNEYEKCKKLKCMSFASGQEVP